MAISTLDASVSVLQLVPNLVLALAVAPAEFQNSFASIVALLVAAAVSCAFVPHPSGEGSVFSCRSRPSPRLRPLLPPPPRPTAHARFLLFCLMRSLP